MPESVSIEEAEAEKKRGGIRSGGSMKGEIKLPSDEEWKKVDKEIEQMFEESEIFPGENSPADQG